MVLLSQRPVTRRRCARTRVSDRRVLLVHNHYQYVGGEDTAGELVDEGRTGLLFASADTNQLAQSVRWLVVHPHKAAEMGRRARPVYETNFSAKDGYHELIVGYDRALDFAQKLGAYSTVPRRTRRL
jgi:hypothetical protein